jgi:hypothetical protein
VYTGLIGCYATMQAPMNVEWQLTELRSDNTKMGVPGSSNTVNRDLSDLDVFNPSTAHPTVNTYWTSTYNVIRNANIILKSLGVDYNQNSGTLSLSPITLTISDSLRKQYAGEALVIRANAYFNLVRLYGGVFLLTQPISPEDAKKMNRSSVADIYKLIIADLTTASSYCSAARFTSIPTSTIGRANSWVAKGLLGKVYLTLNQKNLAIAQLQDVITNSGYSLQATYANVFSITNEMNSEILFTVRYKAGNLGLGSAFGNQFAPLGTSIINGSGLGWNYPTAEFDTISGMAPTTPIDPRKVVNMAFTGTTAKLLYVRKFFATVVTANDGESDWPILRYADVLLMLAEAQGFSPASITLINQVRTRVGLPNLTGITTIASFEQALAYERRMEFAFENQRFFDLVRYNSTLTTIKADDVIKNHIAREFASHYNNYNPVVPLAILQSNVNANKFLLPIPQREIDTNSQIVIPQNPGY